MTTKTHWRLVCAKHGKDRGHSSHAYQKSSLEKAKQGAIDADHHSETVGTRKAGDYYTGEAPWRVQTREVTEWEDSE